MQYFLTLIILFWSCTSNNGTKPNELIVTPKEQVSNLTYNSREINSDISIVNTTNHKIIVLYNSVDSFLTKSDTAGVHFLTECMGCEPVQPYQGHLIFGKQMEIFPEKTSFHKKKRSIPTTANYVKRTESYGVRNAVRFTFSDGTGNIKHLKQSCNDAELKEVSLRYKNGEVKINNVLNASFFEYDLNKDGKPEQFILANRNCSQELAIIQIL